MGKEIIDFRTEQGKKLYKLDLKTERLPLFLSKLRMRSKSEVGFEAILKVPN
jgi:hypothetical protein